MKNNVIIPFTHPSFGRLRVIRGENDERWLVATDRIKARGYSENSAMTRALEKDEEGRRLLRALGGEQELNVINESGLYNTAREFKRWVTHEVLPSIRKIDCLPCVSFAIIRNNDERERKTTAVSRAEKSLAEPCGCERCSQADYVRGGKSGYSSAGDCRCSRRSSKYRISNYFKRLNNACTFLCACAKVCIAHKHVQSILNKKTQVSKRQSAHLSLPKKGSSIIATLTNHGKVA